MREGFRAHRATSPPAGPAARAARWLLAGLAVSAVAGVAAVFAGWPWPWLVAVWLLAPLAVWRWVAGGRWADLGLRAPRHGLRTLLAGAGAVLTVTSVWLALVVGAGWHSIEVAELATGEQLGRLVSAVLAGVLLAGVGEELAYRGSVLRLTAAWRGPAVAVGASAVLFAVLHTPNLVDGQGLAGADLGTRLAALTLVGTGLGYAAWRTGGLWLPIAWHAGGNLVHGLVDTWWLIVPAAPAWWAGHQPGLPRSGLLGIAVTLTEVAALCWLAHRLAPAALPDQQPR